MKVPRITFGRGAQSEVETNNTALSGSDDIKEYMTEIVELAEEIADTALDELEDIWSRNSTNAKKDAWNNLSEAVDFFGSKKLTKNQIKSTRNRMRRIHTRIRNKALKITIKRQQDAPRNSTLATNHGSLISPNKFVIYTSAFRRSDKSLALTIIHELFHDLHIDHKVKDNGRRVTAYGSRLAKKLAKKHPKIARRNPENYEQFCRAVWNNV